MSKPGIITLWVHPKLLKLASRVLRRVGLTTPDAITLFLKQVIRQDGLPFDLGAPSVKAQRALRKSGASRAAGMKAAAGEDDAHTAEHGA